MKTRTKIMVAVGVTGLVAMGSIALAAAERGSGGGWESNGGMRWGQFGGRMRLGERLGLTEEQRGKIKTVLASHKDEFGPLTQKIADERKALRVLIQADTLDEAAIRSQAMKVAAVEADLAVARAKVAQQVRPLLSVEQKQRLQELKAEAEKRGAEFRERIAKWRAQG